MSDSVQPFAALAIRRLFSVVNGATPDSQNPEYWAGDVPWVTPEDLSSRISCGISDSKRTITTAGYASCGTTLVPAGAIVLSTRAPIGYLGIAERDLCTNQGCKSLVPLQELSSKYFFYQLSVQTPALNRMGRGTTFLELSSNELAAFKVWAPPAGMQVRIANFLDEQTARIDALIAEKEQLFTLLTESKESAIERAVLPPEGQPLKALKRVTTRVITGPFGSALHSAEYISGGIPVINPAHIIGATLRPDSNVSVTEERAESLSSYRLTPGELVVGRRGEMGRCALVPPEGDGWICGTGSLLATPKLSEAVPAYLQLVVSSRAARDWLSLESVGSTMENLNSEILGRLPGFFPSIAEQTSRVETAMLAIAQHDTLMTHVEEHISRLREYRSSLISAAVTGQLDISTFKGAH